MPYIKSGTPEQPSHGARRRALPQPIVPPLSLELILGILRESGVPESEARRRVALDPTYKAELAAKLG